MKKNLLGREIMYSRTHVLTWWSLAGVKLKDGVVGTDEEREAKIEETLRRLGVKGASAGSADEKKQQQVKKKKRGGSQGSAMEDDDEFLSSVIEVSRGLTSW